ncbi:MAG: hypothetical protein BWY89_01792 [Bacteroidetes bacterium ADurb.BinA012]|nr:MAG: hypothetical protein BWY89_01792 [Bacteroidetes bacterium ADurb.BinA012]
MLLSSGWSGIGKDPFIVLITGIICLGCRITGFDCLFDKRIIYVKFCQEPGDKVTLVAQDGHQKVFSIYNPGLQGLGFYMNKPENPFGAFQQRQDVIVCHRHRPVSLDTLLNGSLEHQQVHSVVQQYIYRNSFALAEYAKEEVFRAYMAVAKPDCLLFAVTKDIIDSL